MTDPKSMRVPVYVPDDLDNIGRLELMAQAALENMGWEEYDDRLDLASLDPASAHAFVVHFEDGYVILDWPAGCELIRIRYDELTKTSRDD